MAHGSKNFIRDWRGRLKRSRNRTWIDFRGILLRDSRWCCDECEGGERGTRGAMGCGSCARLSYLRSLRWWCKHTVTRRMELEARRRKVRNMLQRARYVPELYDYIPTKHKNGWLD